jgi:hypothetical protein
LPGRGAVAIPVLVTQHPSRWGWPNDLRAATNVIQGIPSPWAARDGNWLLRLGDIDSVRRALEIAMLDALGLDNSVARGRLLLGIVTAGARPLEVDRFGAFAVEDDGA